MKAEQGNIFTKLVTANVTSAQPNRAIIEGWEQQVVCLQETRLSAAAQKSWTGGWRSRCKPRRQAIWGTELQKRRATDTATMHGGLAIATTSTMRRCITRMPASLEKEGRIMDVHLLPGPGAGQIHLVNIYGHSPGHYQHEQRTEGLLQVATERWLTAGGGQLS